MFTRSALRVSVFARLGSSERGIRTATRPAVAKRYEEALQGLLPRERRVIEMRHGFDGKEYELAEIARQLELTPDEVERIEMQALRTLRWGKATSNESPEAVDSPDTAMPAQPEPGEKQSARVGAHARPSRIKDPTAA